MLHTDEVRLLSMAFNAPGDVTPNPLLSLMPATLELPHIPSTGCAPPRLHALPYVLSTYSTGYIIST